MTERKFSIGFTIQNITFNLSESSGAPLQLAHIIRGLQNYGHRVTILALRKQRKVLCTDNFNVMEYGRLGLSVTIPFMLIEGAIRRLQSVKGVPSYLGLFDSFRFYEACCTNLKGCEVLHERNSLFSIGTALASRKLNLAYVLSLDADLILELDYYGRPLRGIEKLVARAMAKFTYRTANALTCVSTAAKNHFVTQWGIPAEKITVLPNGVDTQVFQPSSDNSIRTKLGLEHVPTVMFVGGFYPFHGIDLLVDSFRKVLCQVPQAKLVLVGDGMVKPMIMQQVTDYHLEASVVFAGSVEHREIPAYLNAADVCVALYPTLPTEMWFSPLKLYEYMAAGKAIVASRVGQVAEVIQHNQTGLLVETGNNEEIAQAIIELLDSPIKRQQLGTNARQQAIEHHSWGRYVAGLTEIYTRLINK